jgi:glycosyltransferase involved in cell wall biosynthesis
VRLLYFCPYTHGGIVEYAHAQANALVEASVDLTMLGPREGLERFEADRKYNYLPLLAGAPSADRSLFVRRFSRAAKIVRDGWVLAKTIRRGTHKHVLFGAFYEYMAPLWIGPLKKLAAQGVVFGSVIHDPDRNYVVGPHWWHRWSIRCAFEILREGFVHAPVNLATEGPMPRLRTTVIPHGIFQMPAPTRSREEMRASLGIPPGATVLLAYGFIRDGKNLDLVIQAMAGLENVFLIVAGREQSARQRSVAYYQQLAEKVGAAHRCSWVNRFVSSEETADLFNASDLVLLTYSSDFHSASGVLNVAAHYRKPCLASGRDSNLFSMVRQHELGICIEPDSIDAIREGLRQFRLQPPCPRWTEYEVENSWERNAEMVRNRMGEER